MSQQPYKIAGVVGMNNRLPDYKNRIGEKSYVRNAVNVDATDGLTLKRRKGVERLLSGDDVHSLWSAEGHAYFVDYQELHRVALDTFEDDPNYGSVVAGRRVSYTLLPDGSALAMNGVDAHWLVLGEASPRPFYVPRPATDPLLTYSAGGSLPVGFYQVVYTLVDAYGREGPATLPQVLELTAPGTLTVSDVDQSVGYTPVVYMTHANGDVFFEVPLTIIAGVGTISVMQPTGRRCPTLLMDNMPCGTIVRSNNGRLFTASGNVLYYSEPYSLSHNPLKGFIPFAAPITMVEPCGNGLYVAAGQTYWLGGDIASAGLSTVLPYGAVAGAASGTETDTNVWWMSTRGIVLGNENGQVKNIQEAEVAVNPGQAGAALFREQDGVRQLIASVFGARSTVAAAGTWMEAEIGRKETIL